MVPNTSLIRLSIDNEGFINLNDLRTLLINYNEMRQYGKKRIRLVAVSGASNVMGVYNNLAEISQIVHQYGASLLVDGAQMVAHRKVDIEGFGIDYFAFSAHKVYAPFGCGVLVVKKGLLNYSSSEMELIELSGEENAGGIAALGKSLVLLQRIGIDLIRYEEQALTRRVLEGLSQLENISVYGIKNPDSPEFAQKGGVIVFSVKGIMAEKVANELAKLGGIGVRSGCHCAHILVKHLLKVGQGLERFQRFVFTLVPGITPPGIVRVSLGIGNKEEEVDTLIRVLKSISGKHVSPKFDMKHLMKDSTTEAVQRVYGQL